MNLLFAAAILAQATSAPAEGPEPPAAKAHVANAHGIAGKDLAPIADGYLCRAPSSGNTYLAPIVFDPAIIAGKAFDNLFYIGKKSVGAWASERYRTWFGREEEQTADADREDRTRAVAQRSA